MAHAQGRQVPEASSTRDAPQLPPRVPRKPQVLRNDHAEQERQIQASGEDITFTKSDIIIAVMGVTGAGKSTFISLLSDAEIEIGHGLQSCTTKVGVYFFVHNGVRVFLVDTPGFDDTNRSDSEVLKDVAFWLAAAHTRETQLAGIIYLHRISDPRMQGSALRNLRMFKQLCGTNNLGSVLLVTTHWKNAQGISIPEDVGQARIKELTETKDFWGGMVERGSRVVRHDGSKQSALHIISQLVQRRTRVTLDIAKQLINEKRTLDDTDAGQALQSELIAERKKFQQREIELKEDMEDALRDKDVELQEAIKKERVKNDAAIKKSYDEVLALRTTMKKIAEEKDAQYRELQAEMARQAQQFKEQAKKYDEDIRAHKEEQRRLAEEHRRERREAEAVAAQERQEHNQKMVAMAERMRQEANEERQQQMKAEKEQYDRRYQQQQNDAQAAAEVEEKKWLRQVERERVKEERLEQERAEYNRKIAALELESRKRSRWNPKRWLGDKYRDS